MFNKFIASILPYFPKKVHLDLFTFIYLRRDHG